MVQSISSILLGLTFPIAGLAIGLGIVAIIRATIVMSRGQRLRRSPTAEKVAMFLCAACATVAVMMIYGALQGRNYVVLCLALVQLAFAVGGLVLSSTARRPLSEGFAAIAMGMFAILTGFSIGSLVAPFALGIGVLASHHLSLERRTEPDAR